MTNNVLSVANTFLDLARQEGRSISNMKLQKLLYFAQGHSLGLRGTRIINETPKAWRYGPVFPTVYREFREHGADAITRPAYEYDWGNDRPAVVPTIPPGDDYSLVRAVWDAYKDRSAVELSNMSHVIDGPWDRVYGRSDSDDILDADLRQYFRG